MTQSLNPGTVTANISGSVTTSAPSLPTGATQVLRDYVGSGTAPQTIYSVSAGKTLYIQAAFVALSDGNVAGKSVAIEADVLGDGNYRKLCGTKYDAVTNGSTQCSMAITFPIPVQVPATKVIRTALHTAQGVIAGIIGYEL